MPIVKSQEEFAMGDFDQIKYIQEFNKANYDKITLSVPKGTKQIWKEEAAKRGFSLTELVTRSIEAFVSESKP